jgi:signal transduction histidine kinase
VTRLGHTLNAMLASLDQALTRERRFVNDASHELRTPLTLLTGRIQLARRRPRTVEEHERILDELAVDTDRLIRLADQLLVLGQPVATGETADLADVVRTVARGLPADVVISDVTASGPVIVAADRLSLERIVGNLLTNASRHGAPPVTVDVSAHAGWGLLVVSDAGAGMPPELLQRATERFVRADDARSRPGSGLGLSLVAELVTAYGGELRLCHDGTHVSHGRAAPIPCAHGEAMTVSVLLPRDEGCL